MPSLPFPLPGPLGGDLSAPGPETEHVQAALDRLAYQFKDRPNIVGMLTDTASPCDTIESAVQDLGTLTSIDNSSGVQLDTIGKIIGEARQGFDDSAYRLHLKARVWLNRSSGTGEELYAMFKFILGLSTMRIEEQPPAAFVLHLLGTAIDPTVAGYLLAILQQGKTAGVRAILHWLGAAPSASFCFAGGPGLGFDAGIWSSAE